MNFITSYLPTLIIAAVIAGLFVLAVRKILKDKKRAACGGGCAGCTGCGNKIDN